MTTKNVKLVCADCGSDSRIYALAYVGWNTETQSWYFEELWDDNPRCACGGEEVITEEVSHDSNTH